MPLFMDQHETDGATPEDLARAHDRDLAVQKAYNVRFLTYWLDYELGSANCLVEAPDPEAVNQVHSAAHGLLANRVVSVDPSQVAAMLGRLTDPETGPIEESATRTIVFTDLVGSTALLETLGDEGARQVGRAHDRVTRRVLAAHGGREVKHTGDGFMLAFTSPAAAVAFALELNEELAQISLPDVGAPPEVRIGLDSGTPLAEDGDFFGMTVNVASRLCNVAGAGQILVPESVAAAIAGAGYDLAEVGPLPLKGLASPVTAFRVDSASTSPEPQPAA